MELACQHDVCKGCDIEAGSECPVKGLAFVVGWQHQDGPPESPWTGGMCQYCWSFAGSSCPALKTFGNLIAKLEKPEFKAGFKQGQAKKIALMKTKADQLRNEGKDLNTARIYVRMPSSIKDEMDLLTKRVDHIVAADDVLEVKMMFMEPSAYTTHVGNPEILKPKLHQRRGLYGDFIEGHYTKYKAELEGEDGVYVAYRRLRDSVELSAVIQNDETAGYDGAQENTFLDMTREKAEKPDIGELKSVG